MESKLKSFKGESGGDFDAVLWPQLQRKLCPSGLPNLSLGSKLFEMAREEFGLAANITTTKNNFLNESRFFDDSFGFTLILDKNDPSASLLYARIFKCGNNQIRDYLGKIFKGKKGDASYSFHDFNNNEELRKFLAKEKGGDSFFRHRGISYDKPCIFTVIRDPVSHFLSGYNEVDVRIVTGGDVPGYIVNDKTLPSYNKIPLKDSDKERAKNLREIRFETFVRNILEEHDSFIKWHWFYAHAYPISRILHSLKNLNVLPAMTEASQTHANTDKKWILPTMANITETVPKFLSENCPRFAANYRDKEQTVGLPSMEKARGHASSSDPTGTYKAAKDVWKRGGSVARSLCHLHAFDYACFYGPEYGTSLGAKDIPTTCRDVFASDFFSGNIIRFIDNTHSIL